MIRKARKTSRRKQRAHRIKDQVFDQRESTSKSTWRRQAYASLRQGQPLRVITSATNLVVNQERARWRPIGLKSRHLGAVERDGICDCPCELFPISLPQRIEEGTNVNNRTLPEGQVVQKRRDRREWLVLETGHNTFIQVK